ncbi:MAG TPA: hypothetical protein VLC12_00840, partial [Terriglobales bacterium]|nr:hypothetical protein [Terriglobales bacterium]
SLLARRDEVAFNNLRDPKSGMDWYTAGTMLEKLRQQGVDTSQVAPIAFFENMLPKGFVNIVNNDPNIAAGMPSNWSNTQAFYAFNSRTPSNPFAFFGGNDWTDTEALVDFALFDNGLPTLFSQPQYGSLSAWSTIGNSNYNAFTATLRTRIQTLTMDLNYSFSHSLDDASGLQTDAAYGNNNGNGAFIINPIRQGDSYANSDFDIRHNITLDAVWQMPFGKGRALMNHAPGAVEAILGGWQISGIYRWNTGLPTISPYDDARWATNWNDQAGVTAVQPLNSCFTKGVSGQPKLFGGCDLTQLYRGFRNAYPGETGPRNYLRYPGYVDVDLGLSKTWNMPWKEGHQLQLRWDVFNVTNTQRFGLVDSSRTGMGVGRDPGRQQLNPPDNWSNFTQIQGQPRVMQVGVQYTF